MDILTATNLAINLINNGLKLIDQGQVVSQHIRKAHESGAQDISDEDLAESIMMDDEARQRLAYSIDRAPETL